MTFITTLLALVQSVAISTYSIDFIEQEYSQESYITSRRMTNADIRYQGQYTDYNAYELGTQGESHYEINRYFTYSVIENNTASTGYSIYDYLPSSEGGNRQVAQIVFHGSDSDLGSGTISLIKRSRYISCNAELNVNVVYYDSGDDYNSTNHHTFNFTFNLWDSLNNNYFTYETGCDSSIYSLREVTLTLHLIDFDKTRDDFVAEGFDTGYDDGYGVGYNDGFTLGQGSGNSFQHLFGVLVDTPILFFRKLFGYELFGINLFMALTTIVSLLVALSIFRLVKGIF